MPLLNVFSLTKPRVCSVYFVEPLSASVPAGETFYAHDWTLREDREARTRHILEAVRKLVYYKPIAF